MSPVKKVAAPDADADYFYYKPDLIIDPPLPDAVVKTHSSDFFTLKQKKDEDVQVVSGEITVVSTNVTTVAPTQKPNEYAVHYGVFKKDVSVLFALVAKSGSTVTGSILCRRYDSDDTKSDFWRLVPSGTTAKVEGAVLAFPDGTHFPLPTGSGL